MQWSISTPKRSHKYRYQGCAVTDFSGDSDSNSDFDNPESTPTPTPESTSTLAIRSLKPPPPLKVVLCPREMVSY